MTELLRPTEVPTSLREAIERFIKEERLAPKLERLDKEIEKKNAEGKSEEIAVLDRQRQDLLQEHTREVWLENAAARASQIEIVSHGLKYTHSAAKGTSVYAASSNEPAAPWVGTHSLADRVDDAVGNAAALDVYKLLKVEFRGRTVLSHALEGSAELARAFGDDAEKTGAWVRAFAQVTRSNDGLSSHTLARQVFFPLGDGGYHLLAPLFSTSLQHALYERLHEAQFGERAKEAREARKKSTYCEHPFADYPDIAVQKFGGTKPQNISQLNSTRHGEAWLLPSCPPTWLSPVVRPPLRVKTVFGRWFGGRRRVRMLTAALAEFLAKTDYNNVNIRRARAAMVDQVVDELVQFAAELHTLEPGWSAGPDCALEMVEALWLDPGRAEEDAAFAAARQAGEWPTKVAARFGNWLNSQIRFHSRKHGELKLGEVEQGAWKAELEDALGMIRTEVEHG